eukprot:3039174-Pleurochrysis_carterae.AAC.1
MAREHAGVHCTVVVHARRSARAHQGCTRAPGVHARTRGARAHQGCTARGCARWPLSALCVQTCVQAGAHTHNWAHARVCMRA